MPDLDQLRRLAREIFDHALSSVNPRQAVLRAIVDGGSYIDVCGERIDLSSSRPVFAVAIGKAAVSMALGLEDAIGDKLARGLISAPASSETLPAKWETFNGGHPLPNKESLEAAEAAFNLLDWANDVNGVVIFLVSGGGSAMMEYPISPAISLDDMRRANELLIACGARINEINAVRRAFSAIKGGGLARYASHAQIVTLIVSDTNAGDEANVASGPTLSPTDEIDPSDVVKRYRLDLPCPVLKSAKSSINSPYAVLLDNSTALEAAQRKAAELGFASTIADHICEQPIEEGCELLLRENTDCVISGGEFSCPVRGNGIGGRNLETVLRMAFRISGAVFLSAGTDGIDGNSPAAGAIADPNTLARAGNRGLDAHDFLARSDSYTFFEKLGDVILTGPTGTNVRDLRILLKTKSS